MSGTVLIGEVAEIQRGSIDPRKHPETAFELYSIPGYDDNRTAELLVGSAIGSSKTVLPDRGVLFSKLNPRINRVWSFKGNSSAKRIASTEFVCLVPDEGRLDLEYLAWRLRAPRIVDELPVAATAATKSRERIQPKMLLKLPIVLPGLDQQRRIVAMLNRAAKIQRLQVRAAETLRELVPAYFVSMFGDPVANPMNWPMVSLGDVVEEFRYGTSEKCNTVEGPADLPVLRIPNVVDGIVDWDGLKFRRFEGREAETLRLKTGDILFVRTNGNPSHIGRCAVFDGSRPAAFASYLIRARLTSVCARPAYLADALALPSMRRILLRLARTTAGNYNISIRSLVSLMVPLPPSDLQARYECLTDRVRALASQSETARGSATLLTNSMMENLLSSDHSVA